MTATDDRWIDLEIRLTHQALQLEELHQELVSCYRRIEALERDNLQAREMLRRLGPDLSESPDE